MPGIERQSDYYGFVPEVAQRAAAREAGAAFGLPSDEDISGLLSGPSIIAGMHDHRGRDTGPVQAGRAVTADHGDMALLDGIASENGWSVESVSDPGGVQRSMYRDGTEYVIGVRWKKFSPDVLESANLSTQDPLGWPRDGLGETTNLNVVKDWLQHSFLDDPADIYSSKVLGTGFRPGPHITAGMHDHRRRREDPSSGRFCVGSIHVAAEPFVQDVFARIHVRPASSGGYAWDSVVEDKNGDAIERSYGTESSYDQAYQKATANITKVFGELTQQSTGPSPWEINGPTYASKGRGRGFSPGPATNRAVTASLSSIAQGRTTVAALPTDPAAAIDQITDELGWASQSPAAIAFDDWLGERFYNEGLEPTGTDIGEIAAKARTLGWVPEEEKWLPSVGAQRLYDEFAAQNRLRTLVDLAGRYERDEVQGDPMRAAIILDRNGVDARGVNFMVS